MPAKHRIDDNAKLIITTWEDEAIDVDLIEAIKDYQKNIQSKDDYLFYNELVDFSSVTGLKLTVNGIKRLGSIASCTDQKGFNKKLALIVNSNVAYGFAKMYETYRGIQKNSNKEVRVFRTRADAFRWLQATL